MVKNDCEEIMIMQERQDFLKRKNPEELWGNRLKISRAVIMLMSSDVINGTRYDIRIRAPTYKNENHQGHVSTRMESNNSCKYGRKIGPEL